MSCAFNSLATQLQVCFRMQPGNCLDKDAQMQPSSDAPMLALVRSRSISGPHLATRHPGVQGVLFQV